MANGNQTYEEKLAEQQAVHSSFEGIDFGKPFQAVGDFFGGLKGDGTVTNPVTGERVNRDGSPIDTINDSRTNNTTKAMTEAIVAALPQGPASRGFTSGNPNVGPSYVKRGGIPSGNLAASGLVGGAAGQAMADAFNTYQGSSPAAQIINNAIYGGGTPSQYGPNPQMPKGGTPQFDDMISGAEKQFGPMGGGIPYTPPYPKTPLQQFEDAFGHLSDDELSDFFGVGDAETETETQAAETVVDALTDGADPKVDTGGDPDGGGGLGGGVPEGFFEPIIPEQEIRKILDEPTTPDYGPEIATMFSKLRDSANARADARTKTLTEAVGRRESQITNIADALRDKIGPLEADRILMASGITAETIARGNAYKDATAMRQQQARAGLGEQVTDEYEAVAELTSGLAGSQATSSADVMNRLNAVANMLGAERGASPELMSADAKQILGDEQFRIGQEIATKLSDTLADLAPEEAQALLQEKMRQGEFDTGKQQAIAQALLGDLTRRVTATESAWEQARLEAREDARYEIEDQFRRDEIALQDAEAEAEAAQAATTVGQLKSMGFQDEVIGMAMQAAGAAYAGMDQSAITSAEDYKNRFGKALADYLVTFQQNSIGGPNPLSEVMRFQIESAAMAILDIEDQMRAIIGEGTTASRQEKEQMQDIYDYS